MPQKTVFIRDGDLDKWNAIEKKSEFIHIALSGNTPESIIPLIKETELLVKRGLCKIHGTPLDSRGRCLTKDCKYN